MEEKNKIIEDVKKMKRVADQNRSIYSSMCERVSKWNMRYKLYSGIGSALTAMLIFTNIQPEYVLILGIFSATVFIASIVPSILEFEMRIFRKKMAIQKWGDWIKDSNIFCEQDTEKISIEELCRSKEILAEQYKKVMSETPIIPDKWFNKYKRCHLQKIVISKELDKTPFKSIFRIKLEMWHRGNSNECTKLINERKV